MTYTEKLITASTITKIGNKNAITLSLMVTTQIIKTVFKGHLWLYLCGNKPNFLFLDNCFNHSDIGEI